MFFFIPLFGFDEFQSNDLLRRTESFRPHDRIKGKQILYRFVLGHA